VSLKADAIVIIKDSDTLFTKVQNNGSHVPCFQRLDSIVQMYKTPSCYNIYLSPDVCSFMLGFFEWNTTQVYKETGNARFHKCIILLIYILKALFFFFFFFFSKVLSITEIHTTDHRLTIEI
jgi:hypothetical protein